VWFELDGRDPEALGMEQVLARLQAVVRFTHELERRLGDAGLGSSIGDVLARYRRLKATLDAIPAAELARVMADAGVVARGLAEIGRVLGDVKRLKSLLAC
jgi:hypothetical protein